MAIGLAACGRIGFDGELTPDVADQARASIAVGQITSCAIRDGDVYCWGVGEEGQIGPDGPAVALRPVRVTGIPKATKIAAAIYHACMLSEDGDVWCWGGNEYGRIGVTPPQTFIAVAGGPRTDPLRVDLPGPAIDISVSNGSSCAVLASGHVSCWGRNHYGQLGRGTTSGDSDVNLPALAMNLSDATRVSLDDDSACALRADGTVACWGENGRGLIDASDLAKSVPTPVAGFASATAIGLGGDHVCAVMNGRVGCRGANESGQLGDGEVNDSDEVVLASLDDAVTIEAAFGHTCAVRANGIAQCWGNNESYTVGDGTFEERLVPTSVVGMDDAIAISTGDLSTCAVRASGAVTCWGYGARGQIGDGRAAETRARRAMTLSNAAMVAVGDSHTCMSDTIDVACWGANRKGQRGNGGNREPQATPEVLSFGWPSGIVQLAAGHDFTCALLANATVYCWGENHLGQLGIGDFDDRMTPVLVTLPATKQLATGGDHACALATDRSVRCWGYNDQGQLGDGTMATRATPALVAINGDQIVAGDSHTCVRDVDQVSCWGANGNGELGDGTQQLRTAPTPIAGGTAFAELRAGGSSTCGAPALGAILCWGRNDSDVLQAPLASYYQPTPVASTQTQLFTIGGSTACHGATCWGANYVGQVGAGDLGYYGEPTTVMDLPPGQASFAISSTHACAVVSGATYCWGENASGEIGAGTTSTATFAATTVAFP